MENEKHKTKRLKVCTSSCCSHGHLEEHNEQVNNHEHNHGGCSCHNESHKKNKRFEAFEKISLIFSAIFLYLGHSHFHGIPSWLSFKFFDYIHFYFPAWLTVIFSMVSVLLSGYSLVLAIINKVKHKDFSLDTTTLMLVAIIASFAIGQGAEGAAVSLFYRLGEMLEDYAVEKSDKAISKLYDLVPEKAIMLSDGERIEIKAKEIKKGDKLIISAYEKIPADCIVISGESEVDTAAVSGEELPIFASVGTSLFSGSVNGYGALTVRATEDYENSVAEKIIKSVKESSKSKAKTDRFISRFAEIYTPLVVGLAAILAFVVPIFWGHFETYLYRSLVFLVASCPCAIMISVPLGFVSAIGGLSKIGVVLKGGKFIELLAKTDTVCFDKTGTITDGSFIVEKLSPSENFTEKDLIFYSAICEMNSTHPLAKAIVKKAFDGKSPNQYMISEFKEYKGFGTRVVYNEKVILCGSKRFLINNKINVPDGFDGTVYTAFDNMFVGSLSFSGKLRETAKTAVEKLKNIEIKRLVMLTGDNKKSAEKIAIELGLSDFKAELLPDGKTEIIEKYKKDNGVVTYIGDGINDTPSILAADVGFAMGGGSAITIETADAVLMNNDIENIFRAIKKSKKTMRIVKSNVYFAIIIKIIVLGLGTFGLAPIYLAVFADVGVLILCVLNSSRLLKKE